MDYKKYRDVDPEVLLCAVLCFIDSKVPLVPTNDIQLKTLYANRTPAQDVDPRFITVKPARWAR
jgi:hypothetical protein